MIDDTYIGDNDIWHMPVYCLQGKESISIPDGEVNAIKDEKVVLKFNCAKNQKGTWIRKNDKIGQFRIMEVMPEIEFEEVESLGNVDRNGFGSTGSR